MTSLTTKISAITSILIVITFWISGMTEACQLKITPSNFSANLGEQVEFQLERYQSCGRCKLPLEETKIKINGGQLEGEQVWETGTPDILNFKVDFNQAGPVKITIERICPKSHTTVTVDGFINAGLPDEVQPMEALEHTIIVENSKPQQEPLEADIIPENQGSTEIQPNQSVQEGVINHPDKVITPAQDRGQSPVPTKKQKPIIFNIFWIWVLIYLAGLVFFLLKKTKTRKIILFLSLIGIGFYSGSCPCPVGTIFNFMTGNPLPALTIILLLITPIITTLIWGRFFCGWICPLGAIQELIHFKKFKLPQNLRTLDRALKFFKYSILAFLLYLTIKTGLNIFCRYDPF